MHSRTLNHLQTGSNHLPGQHTLPQILLPPYPLLLFSTIFVYKLLLVCILCEASCWAKGDDDDDNDGGRWAATTATTTTTTTAAVAMFALSTKDSQQDAPPTPLHSTLPGHKVQRVAPKVAKFSSSFFFFCCLVPLNRQIPDAIMRRLVKLSHSRTANQSANQVGPKYT